MDEVSGLYNAMINPIVNYGIKGVVWYQGEANVRKAYQYRYLFKAMIESWRKNWNQGDFPFLFAQLTSFNSKGMPDDGDWAMLRESQSVVASTVKNCGMAVTIDLGESHDVHPKNKQDVAARLALIAMGKVYNQNIESSGPVFKSMTIEGKKAILTFDHAASGFIFRQYAWGGITGFQMAGADKVFHNARATIDNNRLVLESDGVEQPVAVRYGWENDPYYLDLFDRRGFPLATFRTDNW
jgi:sialate O-acetylesterase